MHCSIRCSYQECGSFIRKGRMRGKGCRCSVACGRSPGCRATQCSEPRVLAAAEPLVARCTLHAAMQLEYVPFNTWISIQ